MTSHLNKSKRKVRKPKSTLLDLKAIETVGSWDGQAKKPIRNICVVYRPNSPRAEQIAREMTRWLAFQKLNVFIPSDLPTVPEAKKITSESQIAKLDLVVVLGGDGTFLRAVRLLNTRVVPILGVNMGSLGFLTEVKVDELYDCLEATLAHRIHRVVRSTLHATLVRHRGKKISYYAFNDIVVDRRPATNVVDLSMFVDHYGICSIKADGVIVATPTGSTAYSLAAGGPILSPDVAAITVTPVCPHTLTNRPIILSSHRRIRIELNEGAESSQLMVDGQRVEDFRQKDILFISRGESPVIMLSPSPKNYFETLKNKLSFGERAG